MTNTSIVSRVLASSSLVVLAAVACSSSGRAPAKFDTDPTDPAGGMPGDVGSSNGAIGSSGADVPPDGPIGETRDPVDCEEAKRTKSYVGCDYWPTVTANAVWSIFDFTAVVANSGDKAAEINVTGPGGFTKKVSVAAGEVKKLYLPWVKDLKGEDTNECGEARELTASVLSKGGAYHLTSSSPVIVYQFNALQYKGVGGETADGKPKDWSSCPGSAKTCAAAFQKIGCFSFSNDASLLLPSTAMTGNYRVTGIHGWTEKSGGIFGGGTDTDIMGAYFTVTATEDGTEVKVTLSQSAKVLAGGSDIAATAAGGTLTLRLNAGDVAEVVGQKGQATDLSGSLVQANKPVQVITGIPCINLPKGKSACDHVEETVVPVETLGKRYVLTVPTAPKGKPVAHIVRLYGNVDDTKLTYLPSKPAGCPDTLRAGQVANCGEMVTTDFEVSGDHEFAVSSFQVGAAALSDDPLGLDQQGDPAQTQFASVEQFRLKYLFLAPNDYDVSYADIVGPADAEITLDGAPVSGFKAIGTGGFGVYRVKLEGQAGAHKLLAKKPVGVQVMGYGANTSYQYPGGLNLKIIATAPTR